MTVGLGVDRALEKFAVAFGVGCLTSRAGETAPGAPEEQGQHSTETSDEHEYPAHGHYVETVYCGIDGECEHRTDRYQEQADADTHVVALLVYCPRIASSVE